MMDGERQEEPVVVKEVVEQIEEQIQVTSARNECYATENHSYNSDPSSSSDTTSASFDGSNDREGKSPSSSPPSTPASKKSWQNPRGIASSIRKLKERKDQEEKVLGGSSNISLDGGSLVLPIDNNDGGSCTDGSAGNENDDGQSYEDIDTIESSIPTAIKKTLNSIRRQNQPKGSYGTGSSPTAVDDISYFTTEDPPLPLDSNMSLREKIITIDEKKQEGAICSNPPPTYFVHCVNNKKSTDTTGDDGDDTSHKDLDTFDDDYNNGKSSDFIPMWVKGASTFLKVAMALGFILLIIAIALIIVYSLGGKQQSDSVNNSGVGTTTPAPTKKNSPPPSVQADKITSFPTPLLNDDQLTQQGFMVPMQVSIVGSMDNELNAKAIKNFEYVTADRIANELQTNGDADNVLVDINVGVNVFDQLFMSISDPKDRHKNRRTTKQHLLSSGLLRRRRAQGEEVVKDDDTDTESLTTLYMKTTISFRSNNVIQDKDVIINMVVGAFDTIGDMDDYVVELQSSSSDEFKSIQDIGVSVDGSSTLSSSSSPPPTAEPTGKEENEDTPLPTVEPTKKDEDTQSPTTLMATLATPIPSVQPITQIPTVAPDYISILTPSQSPVDTTTPSPTRKPTEEPTNNPTKSPTRNPTQEPTLDPNKWSQLGEDIDSLATKDAFGRVVALSDDGTVLAVGADDRDGKNGERSVGTVRVFILDDDKWIPYGNELYGDDEEDDFGRAVALSADGQTLAVGARYNNNEAGLARVFRYSTITKQYVQVGQDLEGAYKAQFGFSIDISSDGNTVAIGSRKHNSILAKTRGSVIIYAWDNQQYGWERLGQTVYGKNEFDEFGSDIAMSADGKIVVAGGPYANENGDDDELGVVTVLQYDESNSLGWTKLGDHVYGTEEDGKFGISVSVSDDGFIFAASSIGVIRAYRYKQNSFPSGWEQMGQDIAIESPRATLGSDIALSGDGLTMVVGSPFQTKERPNGHVRIYEFDDNTDRWIQIGDDLVGEAKQDEFGWSVACSSDASIIAVGAPFNDVGSDNTKYDGGHVRVFKRATA